MIPAARGTVNSKLHVSADSGATWTPWDGAGSGGGGGGTGTILDGVDATIKATVRDYANSNPIAVALTDAAGDTYSASGSASSSTSAATNVPESAASTTLLASNASRLGFTIYNDSDAALLVKLGTTASLTSFIRRILPRGTLATADLGVNYKGRIDGIWESAPGTVGHDAARVTELT